MYKRKWNDEKQAIFLEHAGKITDLKLARMLHVCVKWLSQRRREHNIPPYFQCKYEQHIEYLRENYRIKTNREMIEDLNSMYPGQNFKSLGLRHILKKHHLIRTPAEVRAVKERETLTGFRKEVGKKVSISRTVYKVGDIFWWEHLQEWAIKVAKRKYKIYRIYVWEQHYGPIKKGYYVTLKDKEKPITIDNLRLVSKAEYAIQSAIDLTDAWVIGTMMYGKDPALREVFKSVPAFVEMQREKIKLIREIKAMKNENRTLVPSPTQNG